MWEWTANHPGMQDPTKLPHHLHGPVAVDSTGTIVGTNPYTFVNQGGDLGEKNIVPNPGDSPHLYGYQQFLSFPSSGVAPLYNKAVVTGSKLTLLIEPLEDQPGLQNGLG